MPWYDCVMFAAVIAISMFAIFISGWRYGRASAFQQEAAYWERLQKKHGLTPVESGRAKWRNGT